MQLADLSARELEALAALRYDVAVEKHEGPFSWRFWVVPDAQTGARHTEIYRVDEEHAVVLPVPADRLVALVVKAAVPSADRAWLTLILEDRSWDDDPFYAGRVAICRLLPDVGLYVTAIYHSVFLDWTVLPGVYPAETGQSA